MDAVKEKGNTGKKACAGAADKLPKRVKVGGRWVPVRVVKEWPPEIERIRKSALEAGREAQRMLREKGIPYAIGRGGKVYRVMPDGTEILLSEMPRGRR